MANDVALLETDRQSDSVRPNLLGERSLSPTKLLGKAPGTIESDNVLILNVSGPHKGEAVRRANALAAAFLEFRADRIQEQTTSANKALKDADQLRCSSR